MVITMDGGDEGAGPWKIALRASESAEGAPADSAIVSDPIPVTPGRRYRLSGRILRGAAGDNLYLDFDDGRGRGEGFEDAQALAESTGTWEPVAAVAQVGPMTTAIRVRFVRVANRGDALCDGLTLPRVD